MTSYGAGLYAWAVSVASWIDKLPAAVKRDWVVLRSGPACAAGSPERSVYQTIFSLEISSARYEAAQCALLAQQEQDDAAYQQALRCKFDLDWCWEALSFGYYIDERAPECVLGIPVKVRVSPPPQR